MFYSGPPLVLASASPRRSQLLAQLGVAFSIVAPRGDESLPAGVSVREATLVLSEQKARAVAEMTPDAMVLGADTLVVCSGHILGKPRDMGDAHRMLMLLSGRSHSVVTGICLVYKGHCWRHAQTSRVSFLPIPEAEMNEYLGTAEPYDKAGAYAIQGWAGQYIHHIDGCFYNIVGLPLAALRGLLKQAAEEIAPLA